MKIVVVIFGGLDHKFLSQWDCKNLKQAEWGKVQVDKLWNDRDVATQITAQLLTGKTWEENGVNERKKVTYQYSNKVVRWLEETAFSGVKKARDRRHALYQLLGAKVRSTSREFLKNDLTCPCLFDLIDNSKAVYVPAYNPEPTWALDRNILDPRRYPELGVEGALDLLEKHYQWRRKRFMDALSNEQPFQLLMGQFQYIDSTQHLYLSYHKEDRMDKVEEAYWRMDHFAGEILALAKGKYDRVLFISDNGAAQKIDYQPTHHNRPFYSISEPLGLTKTNLRDFFHHILAWTQADSNVSTPEGTRFYESSIC